ncbi:hypothetical protein HPB48_001117 [Haemaphysalis longicornis]|uniref:Uncharacterized protein n=1 Tax=Haemaphysalis longicornis TaxID=44386 RepID=A0A9J6GET1_HAELO|nr:hypothetical protein HPB48_001117 [Haemaphysalis longicornis]
MSILSLVIDMRAMYKDLVCLYQYDRMISNNALKRKVRDSNAQRFHKPRSPQNQFRSIFDIRRRFLSFRRASLPTVDAPNT